MRVGIMGESGHHGVGVGIMGWEWASWGGSGHHGVGVGWFPPMEDIMG